MGPGSERFPKGPTRPRPSDAKFSGAVELQADLHHGDGGVTVVVEAIQGEVILALPLDARLQPTVQHPQEASLPDGACAGVGSLGQRADLRNRAGGAEGAECFEDFGLQSALAGAGGALIPVVELCDAGERGADVRVCAEGVRRASAWHRALVTVRSTSQGFAVMGSSDGSR